MSDVAERFLNQQVMTATTFVEIVDTLVGPFDVIDVLTQLTSRCVDLLDEVSAAGILLADAEGRLRVIGASTEQIELLELFQIQNDQGPCLDCFTSGAVVVDTGLDAASPWPRFAAESVRAGFPSVCAIPMRFKDVTLGCLNLFISEPVGLSEAEIALAQALADVASIAIVQDHATRQARIREADLHHAHTSRIAIEQAKGMVAERGALEMDNAFARLRAFSRENNLGLTDVAERLVDGTIAVESVIGEHPPLSPSPAAEPVVGTGAPGHEPAESFANRSAFDLVVSMEGHDRVVSASGELDMTSRNLVFNACLDGRDLAVVVDMAGLTFMDCGGYGGLVAARRVLQQRGLTLSIRNQVGAPARLLDQIAQLEVADDAAGELQYVDD